MRMEQADPADLLLHRGFVCGSEKRPSRGRKKRLRASTRAPDDDDDGGVKTRVTVVFASRSAPCLGAAPLRVLSSSTPPPHYSCSRRTGAAPPHPTATTTSFASLLSPPVRAKPRLSAGRVWMRDAPGAHRRPQAATSRPPPPPLSLCRAASEGEKRRDFESDLTSCKTGSELELAERRISSP